LNGSINVATQRMNIEATPKENRHNKHFVKLRKHAGRGGGFISPRRMKTERLDIRPRTTELCCYLWCYQNETETDDQQSIIPCIIP